jgi:hypothetical protein
MRWFGDDVADETVVEITGQTGGEEPVVEP